MVVLLALVTGAYAKRVHTLRGGNRAVSGLRQFSFYLAIFVLLAEPISPLGTQDENSFIAHMVEHILIGDFAALLMVLGITGPLIQPLLRNPVIRAIRPLTHPVAALLLWIANTYIWHIPFFFEAALGSEPVHVLQHILFFSTSFGVWMALFGPLPQPAWFGNIAKLAYIVTARMSMVVLGNIFVFSSTSYYDDYARAENPWGLTAVADQSFAGAVMMAEGSLVLFLLFGWLFFRAASEGEDSQQLIEFADDHGVEISPSRSARAASAGTTDFHRERIAASGIDKSES